MAVEERSLPTNQNRLRIITDGKAADRTDEEFISQVQSGLLPVIVQGPHAQCLYIAQAGHEAAVGAAGTLASPAFSLNVAHFPVDDTGYVISHPQALPRLPHFR